MRTINSVRHSAPTAPPGRIPVACSDRRDRVLAPRMRTPNNRFDIDPKALDRRFPPRISASDSHTDRANATPSCSRRSTRPRRISGSTKRTSPAPVRGSRRRPGTFEAETATGGSSSAGPSSPRPPRSRTSAGSSIASSPCASPTRTGPCSIAGATRTPRPSLPRRRRPRPSSLPRRRKPPSWAGCPGNFRTRSGAPPCTSPPTGTCLPTSSDSRSSQIAMRGVSAEIVRDQQGVKGTGRRLPRRVGHLAVAIHAGSSRSCAARRAPCLDRARSPARCATSRTSRRSA